MGFKAGEYAEKEVELLTGANVKLEPYNHKPDWINVKLTRAAEQPDSKRTIWNLKVSVPENTPGVRSFEEPDAVVLRIVGTPERFVRIHRRYLLNITRLSKIELSVTDSRVAILADGTQLPISKSGYARLRELL